MPFCFVWSSHVKTGGYLNVEASYRCEGCAPAGLLRQKNLMGAQWVHWLGWGHYFGTGSLISTATRVFRTNGRLQLRRSTILFQRTSLL